MSRQRKCARIGKWGRCQQPALDEDQSKLRLCLAHEGWLQRGVKTPDAAYEEKIVKGLTQPAAAYLTPTECEAMLNGRYRGDGRRLDVYAPPEGPLGINL